jgi:hypothetical protein
MTVMDKLIAMYYDIENDQHTRTFDSNHSWSPNATYNDLNTIIFKGITHGTLLQHMPSNIRVIFIIDSPGIRFEHGFQNQVTSFHYYVTNKYDLRHPSPYSKETREKYIEILEECDFSGFENIETYTTNQVPLIDFPNPEIYITNASIHEGDIKKNYAIKRFDGCTFVYEDKKIFTLPLQYLLVYDCTFDLNMLPIMPNLTSICILVCGKIQFSKFPSKLKEIDYPAIKKNIGFCEQLKEEQNKILDVSDAENKYNLSNPDLIVVNNNRHFFKASVAAHEVYINKWEDETEFLDDHKPFVKDLIRNFYMNTKANDIEKNRKEISGLGKVLKKKKKRTRKNRTKKNKK